MDDPIKQDQKQNQNQVNNQQNPTPVSTTIGGVESTPISVSLEQKITNEPGIEVAPDLAPPEISEDLKQAGVQAKTINPLVSKDAQAAGVSHSIPVGTGFAPPTFQNAQQAREAQKTTVNKGLAWLAAEWLKNLLQGNRQASKA